MIDRFFYASLLVALAAAGVLAFAEPIHVASAHVAKAASAPAAAPVTELPRVVITAVRDQAHAQADH